MNRCCWVMVALFACAVPRVAQAQFVDERQQAIELTLDIDRSVTTDLAPVPLLDAAGQKAMARLRAALDRPVAEAVFFEAPLNRCLEQLQRETGVRFSIDERALADASIGVDTLITIRQNGAKLRTVLDFMLKPHGLSWIAIKEGVTVTTREEHDTTLTTVVYPVADLVATPAGDDFDSLIELITCTIQPNTWKEGGTGEGTVAPHHSTGAIVVAQVRECHEEIEPLLHSLREVKAKQGIRGLRVKHRDDELDESPPETPTPPRRTRTRWSATTEARVPSIRLTPQSRGGSVF